MLVFLQLPGSRASARFERNTLADPEVRRTIESRTVPVRLDLASNGKALAQKHGVVASPGVLFLSASGEFMGKAVGNLPPRFFEDELAKSLALHGQWPAIRAELKANPADPGANARMAWALGIKHERSAAERHLRVAEKAGYKGPYLAKAYNMIGDAYQLADEIDPAIALFMKADAAATDIGDRSYAKVSLIACFVAKRDTVNARKVARDLVKLKGATPKYAESAKAYLNRTGP